MVIMGPWGRFHKGLGSTLNRGSDKLDGAGGGLGGGGVGWGLGWGVGCAWGLGWGKRSRVICMVQFCI